MTIGTISKKEIVWDIIKTSFFLPLMLVSWSSFAQIYRCEINGQLIYQPGPCQDPQTTNMRKLDVKTTTASEDLITPFEPIKFHNAETIKIEENCRNKYSNDARMIRYCVNKEHEAQRDVDRLKGAPTEILNYCYEKWNEWSMREHCINREVEAKNNVFKLTIEVSADIRRHCIKKWDTWGMREHCMKN